MGDERRITTLSPEKGPLADIGTLQKCCVHACMLVLGIEMSRVGEKSCMDHRHVAKDEKSRNSRQEDGKGKKYLKLKGAWKGQSQYHGESSVPSPLYPNGEPVLRIL
jgi:hypothetical protein